MPGDHRQGQTLDEDLGPSARVLRVSRPGYGRTPLRSGRTPEATADLYAALLDALDVPDAVAVGISGGGPSSYAFAQRHPQRCRGLVLCCALQPGLMPVPPAMRRAARVPGLFTAAAWFAAVQAGVRPPRVRPEDLTPLERDQLADPRQRLALERFLRERPTRTGFGNDVRQLQRGQEPPAWPEDSAVPVVVLHGDLDEVVPLAHAQDHARRVPGARLDVLPGLGHSLPLFAREQLADLVRELSGAART
jgi:pimeloyl-ACP methyl ester carboxylesterase